MARVAPGVEVYGPPPPTYPATIAILPPQPQTQPNHLVGRQPNSSSDQANLCLSQPNQPTQTLFHQSGLNFSHQPNQEGLHQPNQIFQQTNCPAGLQHGQFNPDTIAQPTSNQIYFQENASTSLQIHEPVGKQ